MRSVGVDSGGTWTRVALWEPQRGRLRRLRVPSERPSRLDRAVRRALARWRVRRADAMLAGSTGVWSPSARRLLARRLSPLARRVKAVSDLELARDAAFAGGPGVLVVSGTGSAAAAKDGRGRLSRAGGLGPLLGDEGSAFWIGRRWLDEAAALRIARRPDAVRRTAAAARTVLARARRRDRRALDLLREAARELARQAGRAARGLRAPAPLSWTGGMMEDPLFLSLFLEALPRGRFSPRAPAQAPEVFAALAAVKLLR